MGRGKPGHKIPGFYDRKLYEGFDPGKRPENWTENPVPEHVEGVHCRDSRDLSMIPDSSIHLVITSPPYNVGMAYDDNLTLKEYLDLLEVVFNECYRVLVPGGRICLNITDVGRQPMIPLHLHVAILCMKMGFLMRGQVVWYKDTSSGDNTAWGSWRSATNPILREEHEFVLIFCKESFYRDGRGRESTISKEAFIRNTRTLWHFPTVSAGKIGHPAPFPVELPLRCIELYTFEGEVVLDPFCGSGSTGIAAQFCGRRFIGTDISPEYAQLARDRMGYYMEVGCQIDLEGNIMPQIGARVL